MWLTVTFQMICTSFVYRNFKHLRMSTASLQAVATGDVDGDSMDQYFQTIALGNLHFHQP